MKQRVLFVPLMLAAALCALTLLPAATAEAGANGQQLTLRSAARNSSGQSLPWFTQLSATGNNQLGQRVTWSWWGAAYQVTATNWWWKGSVTVQAQYSNGASKTCSVNVPSFQVSNYVILDCSSNMPNLAPAAPSNARLGNGTVNSITLWWNDNSGSVNGEQGFKIERRNGGSWSQITTVPANVSSFNNVGLNGNSQYCYRVRAYNGTGDSAYSNETCAVPCDAICQFLNKNLQLTNGRQVLAKDLPGTVPVQGLDSTRGKPGQFPLNAPLTSNTGLRNPDIYRAVIAQFGVDTNPRYAPDAYTYCNTFAGDVMRAMGVPLPTKEEYLGKKGDPATISAPDLFKWLTTRSGERGWREVNPTTSSGLATLIAHVNAGKPALAADAGHVVVIRPGQGNVSVNALRIAQAGARNRFDISISEAGYGGAFRPRFFIHD